MRKRIDNDNNFFGPRKLLAGGVSVLALFVASTQVHAQAADPAAKADDKAAPEIVVTGIRGSLQKSLDIKKNSLGVVDAISAEDIGKFPDANLAEALQRIPGVSVSRGSSSVGGLPTTTGAATEITVRGFGPSFNETLYDGRKVATATSNRAFDFSAVGSDFVGEVDILKTPDASLSDGAIGATINVKFPKPFDRPGLHFAASASATDATKQKTVTPNLGAVFSDTFANNTVGILLDFAYSNQKTKTNHINSQGWEGTCFTPFSAASGANPGTVNQFAANSSASAPNCTIPTQPNGFPYPAGSKNGWFIQDYGIYQEQDDDKRIDGRAVLQFRPTDNLEVTLNDDYSRDKIAQQQWGFSVWFNGGSLSNVTQNANGTATSFTQNNTPTDFQGQINGSLIESNETGVNLKWRVSDHFTVVADYDRSLSKLNPGGELSSIDVDVGYGPSAPGGINGTNIGIAGVGVKALPYLTNYGPNGNAAQYINNGLIGSHVLPITTQQNRDEINQFNLSGEYKGDALRIKFGFDYSQDKKDLSEYDTFVNNDWQAYAGYGPASNNPGGVALNQSWFTNSFSTSNFVNGFANGGNLPAAVLKFDPLTVLNYLQSLGDPHTKTISGFNYPAAGQTYAYNGTFTPALNAGSVQSIKETTYAFYANFSDKTTIGDLPLRINFGLRAEETDVTSVGLGQSVTSLTVQASDHTAFLVNYGSVSPVTAKSSYRNLLPNLDVSLDLTKNLKLRLDASRTLTRAPLNYLTPVSSVSQGQRVGSLVASGGNPSLKPYKADNLDLGLEWYYGKNSYVSLGAYFKEVSDFIIGGTVRTTINGVIDPTTGQLGQFSLTSQVNGPSASVYGLEAAIQHVFGNSGFGVQANATIVGTNRKYNPLDYTTSGFAVTGLANSANAVVFYEKAGFHARVALNWRDEYLDHFGQQQNNSAFGSEPTYVNANTQIDASTSYDVNKHISVYAEGQNLNNSTYSTHGRFKEQLLDAISYGPRFTVGARIKF